MKRASDRPELLQQLQHMGWITASAWTLVIILGAGLHLSDMYDSTLEFARKEALYSFEKDVVYRRWNADHGGVYVPISELTPPNPYLGAPVERDVTTTSGTRLTLVNPAYMTRQVHELGFLEYGHQGHITSLDPIRPENAADPWERRALAAFEHGATEVTELARMDGVEYLRLMKPLITEAACLKCHAKQGYEVGDVRGGISVSVPMAPHWALFKRHLYTHLASYALVWLLGLVAMAFGLKRIRGQSEELERAKGELQAREARYRMTLDNLLEGCQIIGRDWRYLYVNRTAARHGRKREDELLGRRMMDVYPDRLNTPLFQQLQRCMDQAVPHQMENEFEFAAGDRGCFELYIQPVDEGLLILSLDVTERRRAETALKHNEMRQRTLLETLPDLVWLKDADGVYLACNRKFERFFGATEAQIVGKTDYDFVDRIQADFFREKDLAAMTAGKPCVNEEEITYADDGHRERLETIKTPMSDADGRLIGILGIARDITDRKRSEADLQARIEELQRWQQVILAREGRMLELKREVNGLLAAAGNPPRYPSAQSDGGQDA